MKFCKKTQEPGSVLLVTLFTTTAAGVVLAGYLTLVGFQSRSVARSQTWNSSLVLAEAGIEDSLQFVNKYAGTPVLSNWTNSFSVDNWSSIGAGVYTVRRYMANNSSNYYDVYVTNLVNGPAIYAVGTVSQISSSSSAIGRKVLVQTKRKAMFDYAMAAKGKINLNGNNIATDSFDSADANYSTNGLYDPGKRKGNGDVVTDDTVTNSISVGNADIMGRVNTGPNGTVTVGPNGSIGSVAWVTNGNTGIENSSYANSTMNVEFPDVPSPDTIYTALSTGFPVTWFGLPPGGETITINSSTTTFNQSYNTPGNNYFKLTSSLGGKIYVGTNVHLVLWLTAGASFSGNDQITIAQGGSLKIYTADGFTMSGNAAINNYNQRAAKFGLFGLPACTNISLTGNAAITGTIYAPEAALTIGGGGSTTYDLVGSVMARTVTMNGHMKFHFDEALKNSDFSRGYIAINWREK